MNIEQSFIKKKQIFGVKLRFLLKKTVPGIGKVSLAYFEMCEINPNFWKCKFFVRDNFQAGFIDLTCSI